MSPRLRATTVPVMLFASLALFPAGNATAAERNDSEATITKAEAKSLFQDALALVAAGDYASALDKLQKVASYKRTPAVVYYLGLCHEKTGQWVMALGEYRIALADARAQGRTDVVEEASRSVKALAPKIPHIDLSLAANGPGRVRVTLDGEPITVTTRIRSLPLDPGTRVIEATAPGYEKFHKTVDVKAGDKLKLTIELKKSPDATGQGEQTAASVKPDSNDTHVQRTERATGGETEDNTEAQGGSSVLGWVVAGAGVASLAVAGVFYGKRSSAIDELDAACGADHDSCPPSAKSTYDDGKRDTLIGNVALGTGIAGLLAGAVLIATSSGGSPAHDKGHVELAKDVRLVPSSPGTWAGLTLDGRF